MGLWIRTQKKDKLVKVDNVEIILELDKKFVETWRIVYYDDVYNHTLGTFKTKKRALEVLDEIQNILTLNTLSSSSKKVYNMNNLFYQMPKE